MTKKYCVFKKDMYDGEDLVWKKDEKYKVVYEDDTNYYFGNLIGDIRYGVNKLSENKSYAVVTK